MTDSQQIANTESSAGESKESQASGNNAGAQEISGLMSQVEGLKAQIAAQTTAKDTNKMLRDIFTPSSEVQEKKPTDINELADSIGTDDGSIDSGKLLNAVDQVLSEKLGLMEQRMNNKLEATSQRYYTKEVKDDVASAFRKYGDAFKKNWDGIKEHMEKNPNLSAEKAFFSVTGSQTSEQVGVLRKELAELKAKASGVMDPAQITPEALSKKVNGKSHSDVALSLMRDLDLSQFT